MFRITCSVLFKAKIDGVVLRTESKETPSPKYLIDYAQLQCQINTHNKHIKSSIKKIQMTKITGHEQAIPRIQGKNVTFKSIVGLVAL